MDDLDNLQLYNAVRAVPLEATKPIGAGRLKGMTDINPMWRIKKLTEQFGPCGKGWYYSPPQREFVPGANGEIICIVDVQLFVRYGSDLGEWSAPIPGTGGAKYVAQEKNGLYTDDEAPKKALTDALSVACKALGIGADVYFARDRTKYDQAEAPEVKAELADQAQLAYIRRFCNIDQRQAILDKYRVLLLEDLPHDTAEKVVSKLKARFNQAQNELEMG